MDTRTIVSELSGHQFGVACIAWAPSSRALASAGFQHDGTIAAFDVASKQMLGSAKVSSKVFALAFEDDNSFAAVGHRLVKFLRFPDQPGQPFVNKAAVLGDHAK